MGYSLGRLYAGWSGRDGVPGLLGGLPETCMAGLERERGDEDIAAVQETKEAGLGAASHEVKSRSLGGWLHAKSGPGPVWVNERERGAKTKGKRHSPES